MERFKGITASVWRQRVFWHALLLIALPIVNLVFPIVKMLLLAGVLLVLFYRREWIQLVKGEMEKIEIEVKLIKFVRLNNFYDSSEKSAYTLRTSYAVTNDLILLRVHLDGYRDTDKVLENIDERVQALMKRRIEEKRISRNFDYVEYEFYKQEDKRLIVSNKQNQNWDEPILLTEKRYWNFNSSPHALVVGGTGSGKTYLLYYLIKEFLLRNADISVIDPKWSDLRNLSGFLKNPVLSEKEEIMKKISESVAEMDSRFRLMTEAGNGQMGLDYSHFDLAPIVLVIDEYSAFVASLDSKEKKKVDSETLQLLQKGRAGGVFVVFSMQRADTEFLKGSVRDQIGLRVALSRTSEDGLRMVFDSQSKDLPVVSETGQGYLKTNTMTKPVFFETPKFDIPVQEYFERF